MLGGLKISSSPGIPDGTQIWMRGLEVVDITTNERSAFFAMFGLMRVPSAHADGVMLSIADFAAFEASAVKGKP